MEKVEDSGRPRSKRIGAIQYGYSLWEGRDNRNEWVQIAKDLKNLSGNSDLILSNRGH